MKSREDMDVWLNFEFRKDVPANIYCPICKKGLLGSKNILLAESEDSLANAEFGEIHYESNYSAKFSAIMVCQNPNCKQNVSVLGDVSCDIKTGKTYDDIEFIKCYKPKYFDPPLELFPIEEKCPLDVKNIVINSFKLFFSDTESAANKLRIAIECLCDHQIIANNNTGQKQTLGQRINDLKKINQEAGELLSAIKWIGNFASHNDSISKSDLLDGYSFMQLALKKLYGDDENQLLNKAKQININKKPFSK